MAGLEKKKVVKQAKGTPKKSGGKKTSGGKNGRGSGADKAKRAAREFL